MNKTTVTDFFDNEFPSFAIYNVYRMIGSYVDGLKPSSRKVVYTMRNYKGRVKVAQLCSEVAKETQYLHGEMNLAGVIVNMAQNFPGTNSLNLLEPLGSFGNRCIPEASAPRYIHTAKSKIYDKLFHRDDRPLLTEQVFEGQTIEPLFYVPILPLILINGSEGVGSGWSQKILPRSPVEVAKAIKQYLKNGKLPPLIKPCYSGFTGTIESGERVGSWVIKGVFKRESQTKIRITEIPTTYTLDRYNSMLADLEERKIISSFKDLSEPKNNTFEFVITARRDFVAQKDEAILSQLKLISRLTENYTCLDENNQVREFKSDMEILEAFIKIRVEYYQKRKDSLINKIEQDIIVADARHRWITKIVNGDLVIFRKPKKSIEQLASGFPRVNDCHDYLVNMPIHSFSKETINELRIKVKDLAEQKKQIQAKELTTFWEEDLK